MTSSLDRRLVLKGLAGAGLAATSGRAWAAPATDLRLLVVFLRGAYDAINVVVPVSSSFYYEARPKLAIAKPNAANPLAALSLDADWGLHPALRDSLYPLWLKGEVAFVPFAGPSDDLSRSHFETQDTIELGQSVGSSRNYGSGFMSRLATSLTRARPIAFTEQVPLTFRGGPNVPNVAIDQVDKSLIDKRQAALIEEMYAGRHLGATIAEGFRLRGEVQRSVQAEAASDKKALSPSGFERYARRIGTMMRDQYNLAFVDIGNWDTHANQGAAQGYLPSRVGELGRGLAAFADEMQPVWSKTVVAVVSEFGRTFRENGSAGTDHGHGSVYWVLGGAVKGGRIVGEQVKITSGSLSHNRELPVLTDYRDLLGGLLGRYFGLAPDELAKIFPGAKPRDLGIV